MTEQEMTEIREDLINSGEGCYKGHPIYPAPSDGYTITGFDRYDTLEEAIQAIASNNF